MARSFAVSLIIFLALAFNAAGEDKSSPTPKPDEKMKIEVYKVLPAEFTESDPSKGKDGRKFSKGVEPMDDSGTRYDVKKYFEEAGVRFPPGSEAIYFKQAGATYVRSTQYNLDLIEQIIDCVISDPPILVDVELSAIECSLPDRKMLPSSGRLAYDELLHLAGRSLKLLDRVSLLQESSQRSVVSHLTNAATNAAAPSRTSRDTFSKSFAPGESGTKAEIEPVIAPNGYSISVKFNYCFQRAADKKAGNPASLVAFRTSFVMWDDVPLVLHLSPVPDHEGRYIAIVARARLTTLDGAGVRDFSDMGKQQSVPDPKKSAPETPGLPPEIVP